MREAWIEPIEVGWSTLLLRWDKIAYRGESKNRLQFLCLYDFWSHHPLRLLLLHVNYIKLQRGSINFYGLTIKNEKDFGIATRTNASKNNHDVCSLTRLSRALWVTTQNDFYHPNNFYTRCVVKSFNYWSTLISVARCAELLA